MGNRSPPCCCDPKPEDHIIEEDAAVLYSTRLPAETSAELDEHLGGSNATNRTASFHTLIPSRLESFRTLPAVDSFSTQLGLGSSHGGPPTRPGSFHTLPPGSRLGSFRTEPSTIPASGYPSPGQSRNASFRTNPMLDSFSVRTIDPSRNASFRTLPAIDSFDEAQVGGGTPQMPFPAGPSSPPTNVFAVPTKATLHAHEKAGAQQKGSGAPDPWWAAPRSSSARRLLGRR